MATEKVELTKEGEAKLQKELRKLIDVTRPEVVEELKAARAQGDLSENADYDAARNKQAQVEARIKEIENILANAKIIVESKKDVKVVSLGCKVSVKNLADGEEETYTIVGTVEANPRKGLVSNVSPFGKAVVGKHVGDVVTIKTIKEYQVEITKVEVAK